MSYNSTLFDAGMFKLMPSSLLQVIQTIFFVSGLVTLLQTCFGDRLPIIQVNWRCWLCKWAELVAACCDHVSGSQSSC